MTGVGLVTITPILDQLGNEKPASKARTLTTTATRDLEWGLNILGERVAFRVQPSPNLGPNLIADSDGSNGTWNISGSGLIYNPAPVGAQFPSGGWQFLGNGNPSVFTFAESQLITVVPGQTYTISGFVDATAVSNATTPDSYPFWSVEDARLTTVYGAAEQTPGINGRINITFTVPANVTQVAVICDTNNCIVSNGGVLTFSDPQLEIGSVASPWQAQNTDNAFNLQKMVVSMRQDPWSPVAGSRF